MARTNQQTIEDENDITNNETTINEEIFIEDYINPLGIFLYKWLLRLSFILTTGFIFGLFTTGAPPSWTFVYILPTVYDLFVKIRIIKTLLWDSTELFTFGMPEAILYLHYNNWLVLLLFVWIIFLICEIGIYYQS